MKWLLRIVVLLVVVVASAVTRASAAAILVVSQSAGMLTAIEADGRTIATMALDRSPAAIVYDAATGLAYVSHPEIGSISVVDIVRWRVERTIALGGQPFGLALAGSGRLFVTDWGADTVIFLDLATDSTDRVAVGHSPSAIVVDPSGDAAYSIDRESDAVSVIDLRRLVVTGTVATGRAPFAAALSADGARLYVANVQSGDLSVVDTKARREVGRVAIGGTPYGVAVTAGDAAVLVTDQEGGKLAIVDPASLTVSHVIAVGDYAEGVATLPGTRLAAVANWFSDDISLVDLDTRLVSTVAVAAGPRMLAIATHNLGVRP